VSADSSGPVDGTVVREFLARLGVDPVEVVVEQVVLKPFSVELHLVERDAGGKVVVADGHAVRRTITRPIQWGA
jgi:hypothetical protein